MELKIQTISMTNFKGVKHKEIKLDGKSARLCAQNGGFKTTTADAFYFVFCNCNTAMVNNPDVVPVGSDEVQPTVEIELTIDGKPLTVKKVQKFKKQVQDDKITSSVSNTYFINDIEKTYRDFIEDLKTRGIDTDNFLMFSNPNAFMADTSKQGREKMRSILFKMCESVTDEEIISDMDGVNELKALFDNYKIEEIEQMQKSTLRKIDETVGKDNTILRARIEELISQKSTLDEKVLTAQQKQYQAEIDRIEDALADISNSKVEINQKISELKIKRDEISNKENEKLNEQRTEIDKVIRSLTLTIDEKDFKHTQVENELSRYESLLNEAKESVEKQRNLYKEEQNAVIDEDSLKCTLCGRPFEADKIEEIKAEFEKNKAERLKTISESGKELKKNIKEYEKEIKSLQDQEQALGRVITESKKMRTEKEEEINALPVSVDLFMNDNFVILNSQITDLEADLSKEDDEKVRELKSQLNVNKTMHHQVTADLGYLEKNKEIDQRVAELRQEQKNAEIKRADAERILDQVDKFKRFKNEKLTESINAHFNIISFKLFDYLRNGNYSETIQILIDNKPISSCANGSLIQLAKLDCLAGLQKHFNQHISVFLEDAALITSNTSERIELDSQLIQLVAVDGVEEMVVK